MARAAPTTEGFREKMDPFFVSERGLATCHMESSGSTGHRLCSLGRWASCHTLLQVCRHSSDPNPDKQLVSGCNDLSISFKLVAKYQSHTYFKYLGCESGALR